MNKWYIEVKATQEKKPRIFSTFCYCNNTPIDISTDALYIALTTYQALFYALCIPPYLIPTRNLEAGTIIIHMF